MAAVIPGYCGNLLEVDLDTGKISFRELDSGTLQGTVGGTGLGARILLDGLAPGTDPLSDGALLLILAGPFAGTRVPCADRTSVVCKSPLTGIWAESDVGGKFAGVLRSCGYDGLLIRGRADAPVFLEISEDAAHIRSAETLWGRDTYHTHEMLERRLGPRISTLAIGTAGERQVLLASIVSDGKDARVAARCGVGAVMGSKMLKAVVVLRGGRSVPIHDAEGLRESVRQKVRRMTELSGSMREYGTASGVEDCHALGDFPIKNWQLRQWERVGNLGGSMLGQGIRRASADIAPGDTDLDLQVKGLEIPSHDPRAFSSIALGYATSPRGACHLQAYSHGVEAWLAMPELGFPGKRTGFHRD